MTFHLYLPNFSLWHLSLSTSEEGCRWSLLSCELHYSDYFLINVADKPIIHHLMQRQQATPNWKLLILSLILSLQTILPTWIALESFASSPPLLWRVSSSGTWYPHIGLSKPDRNPTTQPNRPTPTRFRLEPKVQSVGSGFLFLRTDTRGLSGGFASPKPEQLEPNRSCIKIRPNPAKSS